MREAGRNWRALTTGGILLAILLAALFLRLRGLGEPGLWIDEDITWLSVRGILEEGLARQPSGGVYGRAPLYHYLVSLFVLVGGDSELVLRLPSVLASLALIVLVFRFGQVVAGPGAGLVAAALVALSPWDVHFARMGRMYSLFFLFFTLSIYLVYRGLGTGPGALRARRWSLVATVLTVLSHQLGAVLGLVFLTPLLFPRGQRPPGRWLLSGVLAAGLPLVLLRVLARMANRDPSIPFEFGQDPRQVVLPLFGPIELNHARLLLLEVWRQSPVLAVTGLLILVGLGAWLMRGLRARGAGPVVLLLAATFVVAIGANQLVVALLVGAALVKCASEDLASALRLVGRLVLVLALGTLALLVAAGASFGWASLADRSLLRAFVALPKPWWRLVLLHSPRTSLVVLAGMAVALLASVAKGSSQRFFFLGAAYLGPLLFMGILPAPYFLMRYTVYLQPLLAVLFAASLVWASRALAAGLLPDGKTRGWSWFPRARVLAVLLAVLGLFLMGDLMDPRDSWGVSRRSYGSNRDRIRDAGLNAHFYYDARTTALYLRDHRGPGDLVIARDPVNLYPYMGASDFLVRGPRYAGVARVGDGPVVDKNLGIPVLSTRDSLEAVLREQSSRRIWIVSSDGGDEGPNLNLPREMIELLRSLDGHRVYTGEDGISFVLRIDPAEAAGNRVVLEERAGG